MLDLKMLKMMSVVVMVGILSGSLTGCGNGDGDDTGSISGTVYSDIPGGPLEGALLTAIEGTAHSGADGSYKIMNLPAGTYSVKASKLPEYTESAPQTGISVVSGNNTDGIDFTLVKP